MEIFRRQGQHGDFYVERTEEIKKRFNKQSDEQKDQTKDDQLEQRLLSITLHIVESSQEFFSRESSPNYYLDRIQWLPYKNEDLKEAKELFFSLKSIEEKIAQLFFYAPTFENGWESFMNSVQELQNQQSLGGVLCGFGSFEKQCSYIRSLNRDLRMPLLLGARLENSLHYYMASRDLSLLDCQNIFALGEDLGAFLDACGVVFSLVLKEIASVDILNYSQLILGLKHSGNIQGKMYDGEHDFVYAPERNPIPLRYSLANTIRGLSSDINFSALKFIGSSILSSDDSTIKALGAGGELFVFSGLYEYTAGIKKIAQLIRLGKISPELINKNVMKVLLLKQRVKTSISFN